MSDAFGRNLLKNWDAEEGFEHWECVWQTEGDIVVETSSSDDEEDESERGHGSQLLSDIDIGTTKCWATTHTHATLKQIVDLMEEELAPEIMDETQPAIHVSVWTAARNDCGSKYEVWVTLQGEDGDTIGDVFHEVREIAQEEDNNWAEITHVFENYGEGVRYIQFEHGGHDSNFWAGHFGPKMAAPCIKIEPA